MSYGMTAGRESADLPEDQHPTSTLERLGQGARVWYRGAVEVPTRGDFELSDKSR